MSKITFPQDKFWRLKLLPQTCPIEDHPKTTPKSRTFNLDGFEFCPEHPPSFSSLSPAQNDHSEDSFIINIIMIMIVSSPPSALSFYLARSLSLECGRLCGVISLSLLPHKTKRWALKLPLFRSCVGAVWVEGKSYIILNTFRAIFKRRLFFSSLFLLYICGEVLINGFLSAVKIELSFYLLVFSCFFFGCSAEQLMQ